MNERQRRLILILGLAALSACTTMNEPPVSPATADATTQTGAAAAPEAVSKIPDHTAKQIQAMAERLKNHPATLYSVTQDEYTLYIGGVLTASTQGAKGGLTLLADDGRQTACRYDAKGQALTAPGSADDPAACERLLTALDEMLNPD